VEKICHKACFFLALLQGNFYCLESKWDITETITTMIKLRHFARKNLTDALLRVKNKTVSWSA